MFVAALCGTPAVSEARGGSSVQVKTAQASASQSRDLGRSFFSYVVRNYGPKAAEWMLLGGGGFGTAKFLKAGDLNTWARYLFNFKDAKSKYAEKLMNQFKQEKAKFESEKNLFEQNKAKALNDNEKLNGEKVALELSNKSLNAKVKESEKKIEELEDSKLKLDLEVSDLKKYRDQLLNVNNEDNKKIDALLSECLLIRMSGELENFIDDSWKQESYNNINEVVFEPYSGKEDVKVVIMKYDANGKVLDQQPEWLTLPADGIINAIKNRVGGDLINISLKDIGLGYCGIPRLARFSFIFKNKDEDVEKVVAAYFPVKSFQAVNNAENNENNENVN